MTTAEKSLHYWEYNMHRYLQAAEFCSQNVRRIRRELYDEHHFDLVGE